jgi:predicted kinase
VPLVEIPEPALVALVGISGSGKSTFARRNFAATQVLSSDAFRAMVADDENNIAATDDAFDILYSVAGKRLRAGRLTVIDATTVQLHAQQAVLQIAREYGVAPVAIVLDVPVSVCWQRTQARTDRIITRQVLARQHRDLRRSIDQLATTGFRPTYVLTGVEEVDAATVRLVNPPEP